MFLGNFVKRLGQVMDVSAIKMKYYYYKRKEMIEFFWLNIHSGRSGDRDYSTSSMK